MYMRLGLACLALLVVFGGTLPATPAAQAGPLRLVQFGWNMPTGCFFRDNQASIERLPFRYVTADLALRDGPTGLFSRGWWSAVSLAPFVRPDAQCLQQTRRPSPVGVLLRLNAQPADVDWFDDWTAIWQNLDVVAGLLSGGSIDGIFFDPEHYERNAMPVFEYASRPQRSHRSFEEYRAQAFSRGREFMRRLQSARRDILIFLTFAYDRPLEHTARGALQNTRYALLPAFLDGMLDAAMPGAILVDGYSRAYGFRRESQFQQARLVFQVGVLPLVRDAQRYRAFFRLGFGIWLDYNWPRLGWSPHEPELNYFTPAGLVQWLRFARRYSDGYAWVYSNKFTWWNPDSVSQAYVDALHEGLR